MTDNQKDFLQMQEELNNALNFPHQIIKPVKLLGSTVLWVEVSKQPKTQWNHGILENSDYIKLIVQTENNGLYSYNSRTIRSVKKPTTKEKLIKTLINELKKWNN